MTTRRRSKHREDGLEWSFVDGCSPGTLIVTCRHIYAIPVFYPPDVKLSYAQFEEGALMVVVKWETKQQLSEHHVMTAIDCRSGRLFQTEFSWGSVFNDALRFVE